MVLGHPGAGCAEVVDPALGLHEGEIRLRWQGQRCPVRCAGLRPEAFSTASSGRSLSLPKCPPRVNISDVPFSGPGPPAVPAAVLRLQRLTRSCKATSPLVPAFRSSHYRLTSSVGLTPRLPRGYRSSRDRRRPSARTRSPPNRKGIWLPAGARCASLQ